jgi:hypothetical protein
MGSGGLRFVYASGYTRDSKYDAVVKERGAESEAGKYEMIRVLAQPRLWRWICEVAI